MQNLFQTCATLTVSTIAGFAIAGGVAYQPAYAATFSSTLTVSGTNSLGNFVPLATSTFSYNKTQLSPQEFGYTLLTLEASITMPFFSYSYSLADLPTYASTLQTFTALIPTEYQSIVSKYQGALTNVINRTIGLSSAPYDYVGDGDFPPPNTTLTFTGEDVPAISYADLLFPQGGRISLTSTVDRVPVPGTPLELTPQSLAALLAGRIPPLPPALSNRLPITQVPVEIVPPSSSLAEAAEAGGAAAVPEPTTMLGAGLAAGAAAIARRRKLRTPKDC